ncbi:hypothetical protein WOLCODRAFT_158333 [Wolfiporia cocos MD-104 SS10]|uniref:Uncharacterized protein n=1 Tax=Wolfiporia cocos (strain MD-104) TaxID=742152 RepID=A0A2H3J5T8_WOLCO|nr:hypothetical protein WOLCODRAFT_158333 [Wolfiporia cocos MD-104 SS10]
MRPDRPCQGAPPLQTTAHGSAACLTNRALGLDDPQLHPAPHAYPQGRTNPAKRGPPSALEKTRQLTSKGIPPSAHGGTIRLNNWDLRRCSGLTTKHPRPPVDPRGNPARANIERGAASATVKTRKALQGPLDIRVRTRIPPDTSGSDETTVNGRAPAEGHTARATARVWRATAHSRQGNPPRTKSNSGAAALPNAPPLPLTAPNPGRAASTPQGSKNERQRPSTLNRATAALKAYPGTVRTTNGTGTQARRYRAPAHAYQRHGYATAPPVHSDTAHDRLHQTQQGPASFRSAGNQRRSTTPNPEYPAKRRRHRLSSKGGGQGNKSSEGQKEKTSETHLWEQNAHVGLGQPRTRHHTQSGRSGHPSVTVPLAISNRPAQA